MVPPPLHRPDGDSALTIRAGVAVPRHELTFRASRSGGPGGQHVNTSSTRVELTWSVADTRALTPELKARAMSKLATRLDGEGILRLVSDRTRSQAQNKEDVTARFVEVLRAALDPVLEQFERGGRFDPGPEDTRTVGGRECPEPRQRHPDRPHAIHREVERLDDRLDPVPHRLAEELEGDVHSFGPDPPHREPPLPEPFERILEGLPCRRRERKGRETADHHRAIPGCLGAMRRRAELIAET